MSPPVVRRPLRRFASALAVAALLAAATSLLPAATAGAQSGVSITGLPALQPAFDPGVPSYVTRCSGSGPVRLLVNAPAGSPVSVDGQPGRTGRFIARVALTEGQRFSFQVGTQSYDVRCLPADFPAFTAQKTGPTQAAYYLVTPTASARTPSFVVMFDSNGVPVWWERIKPQFASDFKLLPDGNLAWHIVEQPQSFVGFSTLPGDHWEIHRLDGTLVNTLRAVGTPTDLHEFQQLSNGDYIVTSFQERSGVNLRRFGIYASNTVLDAVIQELTPAGQVVWSWDSKDHIAPGEVGRWGNRLRLRPLADGKWGMDWRHLNSVQEDGDGFVISMRHTDSLYKINKQTGAVEWKLGGTWTPESLRIVGDKYANVDFGGQHDARVLPDGTITLYDNGTHRGRPPRALRFQLDLQKRTATLVETVTDPQAPTSFCCGSARKLPAGNWVVDWGANTLFAEETPQSTPVLRVRFTGSTVTSYRVEPVLPGQLSADAVRAGMDAMHPRP